MKKLAALFVIAVGLLWGQSTSIPGGGGGGSGSGIPLPVTIVKPVLGDFTAINQNDTTATSETYGVVVSHTNNTSPDLSLWVKTAPATPYTITAYVSMTPQYTVATGQYDAGLAFRESATSKIIVFMLRWDPALATNGRLQVDKYTNATTFSSNAMQDEDAFAALTVTGFWLRIEDTGTNIVFYASGDGARWESVFSEARGTFFTTAPDQVGFGIVTRDLDATFYHWGQN